MNHHRTSFPQMQIQEMVRHVLIFFKADPNSISIECTSIFEISISTRKNIDHFSSECNP